jgi:DNA-binding MarR family transcriptional regulator
MVELINYIAAMSLVLPVESDCAADRATFVAFMTLFGSIQQALKYRMQDEAEQGLGPQHLRALCLCQANPGWTQQNVVQAMGRDKGQVARLVRDLEARDYLVRTADPQDLRLWRLTVTPAGDEKCAWFTALEAQLATDMMGGLALQERTQLERLLTELRKRIEVHGPSSAGRSEPSA